MQHDAVYCLHTENAVGVAWSFDDEARLDIRFRGGPSLLAEVRLGRGDDGPPVHLTGKWLAIVGARKKRPVIWRGKECLPFKTKEEAVVFVVTRFLSLWCEYVHAA